VNAETGTVSVCQYVTVRTLGKNPSKFKLPVNEELYDHYTDAWKNSKRKS